MKKYGIPHSTIAKRLKQENFSPASLGRYRRVFDDEFEQELIEYAGRNAESVLWIDR